MLTELIVGIISVNIQMLHHFVVYLKLMQGYMSIPSRFKTWVFSRTVMLWHIYNFGPEYFITPFCEPSAEQITTATNYWALTTIPTILHTPPNIILYNSCMRWVLSSPCSRLEKRRLHRLQNLKRQMAPSHRAGNKRKRCLHLSFPLPDGLSVQLHGSHIMKPTKCVTARC